MSLILTEEQELLRDSAASFVADKCSVNQLRNLRQQTEGAGFDKEIWRQVVELGWPAIPFTEEYGGLGLGYAELGIVFEELGKQLVVHPLLSSVVLGGGAIAIGGSDEQKRAILPGICQGSVLTTLAYQETARHDPYHVETSATKTGDKFTLSGRKVLVLDGCSADHIVVLARTSGKSRNRNGLTLFLVPATTPGLHAKRNVLLDSRSASTIELKDVTVDANAVIGTVDQAADILDEVLDNAAVVLSAEMLGGIQQSFDTTLEYLKTREQFGALIGSFQALKHRAARWFCEVELTRSIVLKALRALDDKSEKSRQLASAAKARASDTFFRSGKEGIQMHGGIGVTDEYDIGFYFKRARVTQMLFGDSGFHRDAFAAIKGF